MNDCNSLDFKKDGIRMTPYYINRHHEISLFRAILEKNRPDIIEEILEKTSLKKLGLTPMIMSEIYYDYNFYNKATEYLLQVKDKSYYFYIIDLLRSMGKNKEALEIIISDKENEDKEFLVKEILKKEPELKSYVNELSIKYKVSLC